MLYTQKETFVKKLTSLLFNTKIAPNSLLSIRKISVIRRNLIKGDEKMIQLNKVRVT